MNFDLATRSAIFLVSKMGPFGKSACFWTTKNGTSGAPIKILWPLLYFKHLPNMVSRIFISWICHFWAQFWLNFNFGDFRAYFSHFSLVKIDFFKIHFHLSKKKFGKNKNHPQFLYHINQWKNTGQFDFGTFCYFQPYLLSRW